MNNKELYETNFYSLIGGIRWLIYKVFFSSICPAHDPLIIDSSGQIVVPKVLESVKTK